MASQRERLLDLLVEHSLRFGRFRLASGKTSDYYIDGKRTTLHPEGLLLVAELFLDRLGSSPVDAVGGVTIGGDPIVGAMTALGQRRGLPRPGFLIRKEVKEHGTGRRIEGIDLEAGRRVAIVEDVVSTGGSAVRAARVVKETGATVDRVLAIVDRQMGAGEAFAREGIAFEALFTRDELLARAEALGRRSAGPAPGEPAG